MLNDRYGVQGSTQSRAAMDKFDAALEQIRLYRGDPIAALDAALDEDGDFGGAWALRAGLLAQQTDRLYADEIDKSLRAGAAARLNDRERMHLKAAQDWAGGRYAESLALYCKIAREYPRDLTATQYAHVGCFYLGRQQDLRDAPLQALRAFGPGDDGRGALLGMAAFGFEECGDYARAEDWGRQAVTIDPRDAWAVHAVAHVHEMRGDVDAGTAWLVDGADAWAPENAFAYHNWWHLALLELDRGRSDAAMRIYDEKVRPDPEAAVLLEWIDASALLWRLRLEGVDTGDRFAKLAACWARAAEDSIYAFNDVHAIMAFIGADRMEDASRTLQAMRAAARGAGDNADMSRAVGVPLAEALLDFAAGRDAECVDGIARIRGVAQRFGGSHAQRDLFSLTALHAALRGGMREAARAFAFERVEHKPHSAWAKKLMRRAAAKAEVVEAVA